MTPLISFLTSKEKNITIVGNFNLEVAAASEQRKLCSLHVISECFSSAIRDRQDNLQLST